MRAPHLLSVAAIALICHTANAQSSIHAVASQGSTAHIGHRPVTAAKTTSTASRLVEYADLINDGSAYVPTDSATISYSGTRGGDLAHQIKFDNAAIYTYNTTTASYVPEFALAETFDANNNVLTETEKQWFAPTNSYRNFIQVMIAYDAANNPTSSVTQQWDSASSAWVNGYKQINTYDANHNNLTQISQNWNTTTSAWVNSYMYMYTYNSGNKMTQEIDQNWDATNNVWVNSAKNTYTYDANNNLVMQLDQFWDTNNSVWMNYNQYASTFDASNNKTGEIDQTWVTDTWINTFSYTYSNFTLHSPGTIIEQTWDPNTLAYVNAKKTANTYNTYGQLVTLYEQSWNTGGFWQAASGDDGNRYYYQTFTTAVAPLSQNGGEATIYPNPATDVLHIDLKWEHAQPFAMHITDLQGRVVYTSNITATASYNGTIATNSLAAGNYILTINGTSGSIVKQLTVAQK